MYRTDELRLSKKPMKVPELSDDKIARLSAAIEVDVGSRIEILQALAGHKWVGEASHHTSSKKPSVPTAQQDAAMSLLKDMDLAFCFDWIERHGKYFSWVQFAINKPMLDIFMDNEHPFNIIEEGVVYGYPTSSTLAFAGIIPAKRIRQKDAANYYLSGVNSERYYEQEVEYAQKIWQHLCDIAPELTAEAHESYINNAVTLHEKKQSNG